MISIRNVRPALAIAGNYLEGHPRVRLRTVDRISLGRQCRFQYILRLRLTVNQMNPREFWRPCLQSVDPLSKLRSIRVSTIAIDYLNLGSQGNFFTKNPQKRSSFDYSPAERMFSLETNN